MAETNSNDRMEKIVSLCRRRGFIFQSSEIYGGLNGLWDYGPLGVALKRNIKEAWWRDMVTAHNERANKVVLRPGTKGIVSQIDDEGDLLCEFRLFICCLRV